MTLPPGDVVLTGAPGRSLRLTPGGTSTVAIPGIGVLTNPVRLVDNHAPAMALAGAGPFAGEAANS
jgi:hypothetical protein